MRREYFARGAGEITVVRREYFARRAGEITVVRREYFARLAGEITVLHREFSARQPSLFLRLSLRPDGPSGCAVPGAAVL